MYSRGQDVILFFDGLQNTPKFSERDSSSIDMCNEQFMITVISDTKSKYTR